MEGQKLTETIFNKILKKSVVYAEIADRNAMGQPGIARIYTITGSKLNLYYLDIANAKNQADIELFNKVYDVLISLSKDYTLIYDNAGYGTHAWKKVGTHFKRCDEDNSFIYKIGKKSFKIESLNAGLYQNVATRFADRDLDYSILQDFIKKNHGKFKTTDDLALINMYTEVIKEADANLPQYKMDVDDYWVTIKYLRWKNYEDFNIANKDRIDGIENVARYRLFFMVNQIGWRKVDEIFVHLIKDNNVEIIKEFDKYLFEPIENFFKEVDYTDTKITDPFGTGPGSIMHYSRYPLLMNIDPKVQLDIISQIAQMNSAELEENALPIEFFLANFVLGEQRIPYTIILPAAFHIVETMPFSGDEEKRLDYLFWLACEVIDKAWRFLEEKDEAQTKFKDQIYKSFWPRFGSIWPIKNYTHFKFESKTEQSIYNELLGWIMCLNDIDTRNHEIRDYFTDILKNNIEVPTCVFNRAVTIAFRDYSPKEKFEKLLDIYNPDYYPQVFSYPENIEEAKVLLEELFNPNGRITGINRIATFEQLFINPNSIGVGEYLLTYIKDHFDKFVEVMTTDSVNAKEDTKDVVTSIVTAIAKGISEENELSPYKSICKKALDFGVDGKILEAASALAKSRRKDYLFQRSALQKFF